MVDTTLLQRRYADTLQELDEGIKRFLERTRIVRPDGSVEVRHDLLGGFELRHIRDRAFRLWRACREHGLDVPPPPPTPVDHGEY